MKITKKLGPETNVNINRNKSQISMESVLATYPKRIGTRLKPNQDY